jgi:hypothetical protein
MAVVNTCRIVEGRLMEIDVAAGYRKVADIDDMIAAINATMATVPAETRVIIAADWRPCTVFTPDVAARAVQMLQHVNTRIERSAILARAEGATSVFQVFRLVKESATDRRRVFTRATEMREWLDEVLSEAERQRLAAFLAQRA